MSSRYQHTQTKTVGQTKNERNKQNEFVGSVKYCNSTQPGPIVIREDNQSTINMSVNPVHHSRTKHMHIRYHYLKERVLAGDVVLTHIKTTEQLADILTKALQRDPFMRFLRMLLDLTNCSN